jgi:hypothetical protein
VTGAYGVRLAQLPPVDALLFLGSGDIWHIARVVFSPMDRVGCPEGADCGVYLNDRANVWECVGSGRDLCFPIGDRDYGLSLDFIDSQRKADGIVAGYQGGAGGLNVAFEFVCVPDLEPTELILHEIGDQTGQNISITAWTSRVCREDDWGQLKGGSIFLFVVIGFVLLYVGVGTLGKWLIGGYVEVLNEGFWMEVWASLVTALKFIFSCGREVPAGHVYDAL